MKKLIFCLAVFAFFVACEPAVSSDNLARIAGIVQDSVSDKPISDVYVYTSPTSKTTHTDANGNFELQNIDVSEVQKYTVWVQKAGYKSNHVDVNLDAGHLFTITLNMEPEKKSDDDEKETE